MVTVAIRVITVILYMYIQLDKGQKLDNFSVKITVHYQASMNGMLNKNSRCNSTGLMEAAK